MEFGREAVAEHLIKNKIPTSEKLKKEFEAFFDDDRLSKDIEKYRERIMELRDNAFLKDFANKICELLTKNGVMVVGNIVDDMSFDEERNTAFGKSELVIEYLDFSEHDKRFYDEIAVLKQRIAELENEKEEKPTKINFNDQIKVKLTPLGVEIYYHQYDDLNKRIKESGGTQLEPRMPKIDKDGYTEFTLHHFINLYGEHIGMCKPNVIEPLNIFLIEG